MTEREKMLAGALYCAADPQLTAERQLAKSLIHQYNLLDPLNLDARNALLHDLFAFVGKGLMIEQPFFCDYGKNITIGDYFYANHNCVILDPAAVSIGDNVMLGPNVGIYTAGHPLQVSLRIGGEEFAKPIVIEDNVWIGGNTVIMPGVTIGYGTVVGAASVVNRNLPENVLAVGNPAVVVKEII